MRKKKPLTRKKKPLTVVEAARLGGHARAKRLSAQERSIAARLAVSVRWQRYRDAKAQKDQATRPREQAISRTA